jgi:hypothetical protein
MTPSTIGITDVGIETKLGVKLCFEALDVVHRVVNKSETIKASESPD